MTLALCIPAYNAAWCLPRLLKSAHAQTVPFDEIWVYDDFSTDDTVDVAERMGANVVRGDRNLGCSHGKQRLIFEANADWIHFHDADDDLSPQFVSMARRWMVKNDVDVVAFGCEERWEDTEQVISVTVPDDAGLLSDPIGFMIRNKINAISGLYRTEALIQAGGFDLDPQVLFNEDQAFHGHLARYGLCFRGDPFVGVINYRQRASMWTSNQASCLKARYHVLLKMLPVISTPQHSQDLALQFWQVAAGSASQLDWDTADAAARSALNMGLGSHGSGSGLFRMLCAVSPFGALRVREGLIRVFKPRYRSESPGWRAPISFI